MTKTVYLAGPISGLNYKGATEWRETVIKELDDVGIKGLNPMRAKDYLKNMENLDKNCVEYGHLNVMSSPKGITTRDRWDATRSDMLLVNMLGADRVSIGTVMEIAWADLSRTPIVLAMEEGNPNEHAMLESVVGFRVNTLEEAVDIVKAALS